MEYVLVKAVVGKEGGLDEQDYTVDAPPKPEPSWSGYLASKSS